VDDLKRKRVVGEGRGGGGEGGEGGGGLKIAKPALIHNGLGFLAQQFQATEMTYLVSIKHQKRVHEADHDDT